MVGAVQGCSPRDIPQPSVDSPCDQRWEGSQRGGWWALGCQGEVTHEKLENSVLS